MRYPTAARVVIAVLAATGVVAAFATMAPAPAPFVTDTPLVEALAPRLRSRSLVTSGYLPTDDAALPGFRHLRRITHGGWAADQYEAS